VRLEKLPGYPAGTEAWTALKENMTAAVPGRPKQVAQSLPDLPLGTAPPADKEPRAVGERGGPIHWDAEVIWEAVAPAVPDFTVEVLPHIDSTNSELMRRARSGRLEPVLLVAEVQSAGRGRLGRDWHSNNADSPGMSLTFSLGLRLHMADWSGLSLAVGVSVAQSLHPDLQLKWPNDVWLRDRKLAGILIETAQIADAVYAVIGVGVNIVPRSAHGLSTAPAWLQELHPDINAPQALRRLAAPLVLAVKRFEAQGLAPFLASFVSRDALAGRDVNLSDGSSGQARGVDASGALLVHTSTGLRRIGSSEVSVRPVN
jgi:BirA family transcriptional regulator, biotin operon repressor / biotin---[acetyl-CoA-carboxylase] ligase